MEALCGRPAEDLIALGELAAGVAPVKAAHWRADVRAAPAADGIAAGGEAVAAKSKRQRRKDCVASRKRQLCHAFTAGACGRGDGCRFSHDVDAVVAAKPADLPGACPFSRSPGGCPYGVMCRWASAHAPAGDGQGNGAGGGKLAAGTELADQLAVPVEPVPAEPQPGAAGLPPTHLLPVLSHAEAANACPHGVREALAKRRFDFGRSNAVLAALGISLGKQTARGSRGGGAVGGAAGAGTAAAESAGDTAAMPAAANSAGDTVAGPDGNLAAEPTGKAVAGPVGDAAPSLTRDLEAGPAAPEQAASGESVPTHAPVPPLDDPSPAPPPATPAPAPAVADYVEARLHARERTPLDLRDKLYLAPLTTVGNLPFRALCVGLGADVTCGEMALATSLLRGGKSEWALVRRHPSERCFGVQLCGGFPDAMAHATQALADTCPDIDFVDINLGCPIDCVCGRGAGAALLTRPARVEALCRAVAGVSDMPLTIKVRKGYRDGEDVVHTWVPKAAAWGVSAVTVHGRSRQQRYTRDADWDYVARLSADAASAGLQVIGSGDILSWHEAEARREQCPQLASVMLARGALIKPWLFTEIKERRDWDISAAERLDLAAKFAAHGLGHWGSDARGVETTRSFLLEWLSFAWRYVPVGLLEVVPQRMGWRPPPLAGRSDLETLLASPDPADWVRISEKLLGPAPPGFVFSPKHKSNAYTYVAEGEARGGGGQENG